MILGEIYFVQLRKLIVMSVTFYRRFGDRKIRAFWYHTAGEILAHTHT